MVFDIMVDIETLGTRSDTAFISIGAVAFDPLVSFVPKSGPFTFYRNVEAQSCIDVGMRVDGATIMWWFTKDDAARKALTNPAPESVTQVLAAFRLWYKTHVTRYKSSVWSHGATFDLPIISEAYARLGHKPPWEFWDCKDTRTVFGLAGQKMPNADFRGGGHNALNDSIAQAEHLQRCLASLRGKGYSPPPSGVKPQIPPFESPDLSDAAEEIEL